MRAQVLERLEPLAEGTHVAGLRVERGHSLSNAEIPCGPGARPRQMARKEPVGRPLAQAADRD